MTKGYESDIIVTLIDSNKDRPDNTKCGDRVLCSFIDCEHCPMYSKRDSMDLGQVRALDPRNVEPIAEPNGGTYTGGSVDYYQVTITKPTTEGRPEYIAECNDIIEALGMNFAEGNAFKALWRRAAQRTLGLRKAGAKDDGLYDAEKVKFFGERLVAQSKGLRDETE